MVYLNLDRVLVIIAEREKGVRSHLESIKILSAEWRMENGEAKCG